MYSIIHKKLNLQCFMASKESKLIIGISSRALFDLDESHKIYEKEAWNQL